MTKDGRDDEPRRQALRQRVLGERERAEGELLKAETVSTQVLARWTALLDVEARLRPRSPRAVATPWLALVFGTIAFVALLQWKRCSPTEFSMRLAVSALDVEAAGEGNVELPRRPSGVSATGFESLELPNGQDASALATANPHELLDVRLSPAPDATVNLQPVHVADRTTLNMTFIGPRAVAIRIGGPSLDFQASLLGKVTLRSLQGRADSDYSEPAAVLGRSSADFGVNVTAESWGKCSVCVPLRVRTASFMEEQYRSGLDSVRKHSSILNGKLYFTAVGAERELRRGESLRIRFPKDAVTELVSLSVQPDQQVFDVEVRGWANVVEVGSSTSPLDLRPTLLEWLRSRHGPALVWATCAWLFGVLAVVRKWARDEVQ